MRNQQIFDTSQTNTVQLRLKLLVKVNFLTNRHRAASRREERQGRREKKEMLN